MAWLFTAKEGCMEAVLIINSVSLDGELLPVLPDWVEQGFNLFCVAGHCGIPRQWGGVGVD